MMYSSTFSAVALLAAEAAAHGAVTSYKVAGKEYPGYQAYSPANSKNVIQWQWPSYDPITNAASPQLRCNGGHSATLEAPVAPGDEVSATWNQWTHSQGPIMVWMYKCAGEFSKCDGSGAGWFKIDEAGYHPKDGIFLDSEKPSGWDIAKLVGGNKSWTSKIPEGLAPGNYLIRHELIALHQANAPQFYAECAQLTVTGSGTAQPDASYKAAIPGYCKMSDPNIRVPINNHQMPQNYTIPGPPVYKGTASASTSTAGAATKKAQKFSA